MVYHLLSVKQSKEGSDSPQLSYPARNEHLTLGHVHRLGTWLLNWQVRWRAVLLYGAESF